MAIHQWFTAQAVFDRLGVAHHPAQDVGIRDVIVAPKHNQADPTTLAEEGDKTELLVPNLPGKAANRGLHAVRGLLQGAILKHVIGSLSINSCKSNRSVGEAIQRRNFYEN